MATGATQAIDQTTATAFIATIWSKEAIVAREQKLLMAGLVNRVFEEDLSKMGQVVHVPSIGNLAARTLAYTGGSGAAAVSYETINETNTDITVSTWEYAAIMLTPAIDKQVSQDLHARYAPKMGYSLALAIDDALTLLVNSLSSIAGTLILELAYDDVLRGVQYLDDANAPQEDRCIGISPAQKAGFMKLDQFVHADYSKLNAKSNETLKGANLGTWLGLPVYCSTNIDGSNAAGHSNFVIQQECMALVVQLTPDTKHKFDTDYMADKYVTHQLRGQAIMRNDHGAWLKGA